MPRIQPVQKDQLDQSTKNTLAQVEQQLGKVPNMFATLAHAPAALNAYLRWDGALAGGELSRAQRESIALLVAQANRCQYCLSAHQLLGHGAGLSDQAIADARQARADDPTNAALLEFAAALLEQRAVLSDSLFYEFAAKGLSPTLMLEAVAHVAMNIFTNYLNILADTEIDFPVAHLDQ